MISRESLFEKRGYIFDFDGTLVDSMWVWDNLLVDFLKKYDYETPGIVLSSVAYMSLEQSSKYICKNFELPLTPTEVYDTWRNMIYDGYAKEIRPKDGAIQFLSKLKNMGKTLSIATANSKELTELCLKNNSMLGLFDVLTYADEVGEGKSSPKIYLESLERMNLKSEDCVLFEDILKAVETAKTIGLNVVAVRDESAKHESELLKQTADIYIKSFYELI